MRSKIFDIPTQGPLYTDLIRRLNAEDFPGIGHLEGTWQQITAIFINLYMIGAANVADLVPLQEVYLRKLNALQKSGSNHLETTGLIR